MSPSERTATIDRSTRETRIRGRLVLDAVTDHYRRYVRA